MAKKTEDGLVVYDFENDNILILIHNDDDCEGGGDDDEPRPLPPPNVVDPLNEDGTSGEQQEAETIGEIIDGIQKGGLTNNHETEDGGSGENDDEEGTGEDDDEEGTGEDDDEQSGGKYSPITQEDDDLLTESEYIAQIERLKKARKSLEELLGYKGQYIKENEAVKISKKIIEIDKVIQAYAAE